MNGQHLFQGLCHPSVTNRRGLAPIVYRRSSAPCSANARSSKEGQSCSPGYLIVHRPRIRLSRIAASPTSIGIQHYILSLFRKCGRQWGSLDGARNPWLARPSETSAKGSFGGYPGMIQCASQPNGYFVALLGNPQLKHSGPRPNPCEH
jgi:hypothetical protein